MPEPQGREEGKAKLKGVEMNLEAAGSDQGSCSLSKGHASSSLDMGPHGQYPEISLDFAVGKN